MLSACDNSHVLGPWVQAVGGHKQRNYPAKESEVGDDQKESQARSLGAKKACLPAPSSSAAQALQPGTPEPGEPQARSGHGEAPPAERFRGIGGSTDARQSAQGHAWNGGKASGLSH